jgi:hypothetical protein
MRTVNGKPAGCEMRDTCPCACGQCLIKQPDIDCVNSLIAYSGFLKHEYNELVRNLIKNRT